VQTDSGEVGFAESEVRWIVLVESSDRLVRQRGARRSLELRDLMTRFIRQVDSKEGADRAQQAAPARKAWIIG
jgi:hypothetical protein